MRITLLTWPRHPASAVALFIRDRKLRLDHAHNIWAQLSGAERQVCH